MKIEIFLTFMVLVTLMVILPVGFCAENDNQERSLADNYTALTDDVKWLFRRISRIAGTVEQILPNVTADVSINRSFSEHTRITFLVGLRHILLGIREIAITFEQSFKTDHIEQLHQLKNVTEFVKDLVAAMKMWFSQVRALVMQLLHLYNRYIPEVLFGKCMANYLVTTYPDRSYYAYPIILLTEIYSSIVPTTPSETEPPELTTTDSPLLDADLNVEQNEISLADDYKTAFSARSQGRSSNSESFFDLSTVLSEDKDKIIENAVNQQSWQICLKLYTAESISRSLKIYFLGL